MEAVKAYTEEQLHSAEKLAQVIAGIPDDKKMIAIVAMNAYADGFATAFGSLEENSQKEETV
ncbi:hypothetical protein AALC25_15415 [Lachnospiraceae bacterium 29-84]